MNFNNKIKSAFSRPILCIIVILYTTLAFSYTWPLPGSERLTSSFGEYRTGHFHAGIDLSTPNGAGMRIVAPYEGDVIRVSVQPWGYGLALYYKGPNDIITVYGHLSEFNDEIMKRVEDEQVRSQEYCQDLWFQEGEYHYKAGLLLAKTGDTGAGIPHLHFETRNGMSRLINPFYNGFKVDDTMPPKFQGLMVIPNDRKTTIRHKSDSNIFGYLNLKPIAISSNEYVIRDTIFISSSAGFAIRAFDYQRKSNLNRLGFYKAELFINDAMFYYAVYDSFEYADTRQIGHAFDLHSENWGYSRYHRLFHRDWVDAFPFNLNNSQGGIIKPHIDEVKHIKIVVSDFHGNSSTLRFVVKGIEPLPAIDFKLGLYDWGGAIFYPQNMDRDLLKIMLSKDGGNSFINVPIGNGKDYLSFRAKPGDIARLKHIDGSGASRNYFFKIPAKSKFEETIPAKFDYEIAVDDNFMFITFETNDFIGYPEEVFSNIDFEFELHNPTPKKLIMRIPLNDLNPGDYSLYIDMFDGQRVEVDFTSFDIGRNGGDYYNGDIAFEAPKGGAFAQNHRIIMWHDSTGYQFHPKTLMLKKNARLWIKNPYINIPEDKICLVRKWKNNEYFIDNDQREKNGMSYITGTFSTPGIFALAIDTLAPEISNVQIGNTMVRFDVIDSLSGFSKEHLPEVLIDGVWTICRYDPERNKCFTELPKGLTHGTHNLEIIAEDNCGNKAIVSRKFNR